MPHAVLVTGATGGIGRAIVKALSGYTVLAGVRHKSDALNGVRQVVMDVADPDSVAAAAKEITREVGDHGLYAVVNNAGVIVQGPLELVPPGELRRQFEVNTLGPAYVTQAFLPLLRLGRGRVINISASTARVPVPLLSALSGSKAALAAMSAALRLELAAWNIPVIVVEPGSTATEIFAKAEKNASAVLALADPERVARYARHLAAAAKAQAGLRPAPPEAAAATVLDALRSAKPRRHYVVPGDARIAGLLQRLPAGLREYLLARTLGLTKIGTQA
ncbi:SDR family NAD(P)-dependent oxidoreductase [Nonomuraea sp. B1E8]|uniref:SDR family NAD(P)-dependent oxidoreductase n=1 Tax=unclassified Nonomuraea TaxID=2593643 RepID=UPI00325CA7E7